MEFYYIEAKQILKNNFLLQNESRSLGAWYTNLLQNPCTSMDNMKQRDHSNNSNAHSFSQTASASLKNSLYNVLMDRDCS